MRCSVEPSVSEWASAFVTSDTLHWAMKSVNHARQWSWTSSQWTFVQCVHLRSVQCAVCGQYCDLWHSRYCALCQLPALCLPGSQPSVTLGTRLRTRTYFTASLSALATESQLKVSKWDFDNSGYETGYSGLSWTRYVDSPHCQVLGGGGTENQKGAFGPSPRFRP